MSRITVPYEHDGERKWAIWSTVVDDVILYDATAQDLIEYQAERAAREARRDQAREIIELQNNGFQHGYKRSEEIADEARSELTNKILGESDS